MKKPVLFICIHNSARSQMAEAWLNHFCGDFFAAESAGIEPGKLNPFAVRAMAEAGIDISQNPTRSVFDVIQTNKTFAFVITVCDETSAERCPVFPGGTTRLHWGFPDPSAATGSDAEKLAEARRVRDLIRGKVAVWCAQICEPEPTPA